MQRRMGQQKQRQQPCFNTSESDDGGRQIQERISDKQQPERQSARHGEGRESERDCKRRDEERRRELAQAHLSRVLLHDTHLPVTVLKILTPERTKTAAAVIARAYFRREQQPPAQLTEAIGILVVLFAHYLFTDRPRALDRRPRVGREGDRLDKHAPVLDGAKGRAADAEL